MKGFKIVCNKCGKESIIQQYDDYVDIKGDVIMDYWDRCYDTNKISFSCECGNRVNDK
ncbi:hypothetical protein CLOBY_26850 [Clostridium saccharobutylicum]|uniref:hypothetical protein n=1 Tax=Clostridium saccharobutylicum TaxID=169679 RepID=UPI000983E07F|nr:hypothetical protein [Clostridium saccharobutylicum]AQS10540.1 hypothetical protein CLOBY_26850 [Clostridium saccharobutylicum]MBC2438435.1 hypothetical protein [Clostridium saccharobutylicum]NSB90848.1 hypothetical protein [Clostridium saccharobutylicum]NYC31494.1 hypothetical protein [Clostridium saccharobutylicum]OOM18433.1 hypothetical protein CLSAB_07300 [Clostridium saccharobutylicum]